MESIRVKNQGGIFSASQPKIRIFSKERFVQFVELNADVFQSLARMSTPYGGNLSARD
jgi:hypothetical protein